MSLWWHQLLGHTQWHNAYRDPMTRRILVTCECGRVWWMR